jgi:hypothetical protein
MSCTHFIPMAACLAIKNFGKYALCDIGGRMAVRHSSSLREANNGSNPPTMSALHLSCRFAEDRLVMQFRNGRWVFFGDTLSAGAEGPDANRFPSSGQDQGHASLETAINGQNAAANSRAPGLALLLSIRRSVTAKSFATVLLRIATGLRS